MPIKTATRHAKMWDAVVTVTFSIVMLAGGAWLGARSTLTLTRVPGGSVRAVNEWRLAGVTVLRRSVSELRAATQPQALPSYGRQPLRQPPRILLEGRNTISYGYRDDRDLINGFIRNPSNTRLELTHPADIRATVGSWMLLAFGAFIGAASIMTLVRGDRLPGAWRTGKPLPKRLAAVVVLGVFVLVAAFFAFGHQVFGPIATRKVAALFAAARVNDRAGIEKVARAGVYLDVRDDEGMTALVVAARAGAADAVGALLDAGANPGARDLEDTTALMYALGMRRQACVTRLLDAPLDVQAADVNGRSALFIAAQVGNTEAVTRLIRAGADVNQVDHEGWTPLMTAVAEESVESVKALLAAGANPAIRLPDDRTAADMAAAGSNDDILRILQAVK